MQHYRAVLLIPDLYNQGHVKAMLNVLLNELGFSAAFVHQVRITPGASDHLECIFFF